MEDEAALAFRRTANRESWDESVTVHLRSGFYDVPSLRAGTARLPIEAMELGAVDGLDILHLRCHSGCDSPVLAQQDARVMGLDVSGAAIARRASSQLSLACRDAPRFVEADLCDAPARLHDAGCFEMASVTWGPLKWLHDIRRWAAIVAHFLKPGSRVSLANGHPAADALQCDPPRPGWRTASSPALPRIEADAMRRHDRSPGSEPRRSRSGSDSSSCTSTMRCRGGFTRGSGRTPAGYIAGRIGAGCRSPYRSPHGPPPSKPNLNLAGLGSWSTSRFGARSWPSTRQ